MVSIKLNQGDSDEDDSYAIYQEYTVRLSNGQ